MTTQKVSKLIVSKVDRGKKFQFGHKWPFMVKRQPYNTQTSQKKYRPYLLASTDVTWQPHFISWQSQMLQISWYEHKYVVPLRLQDSSSFYGWLFLQNTNVLLKNYKQFPRRLCPLFLRRLECTVPEILKCQSVFLWNLGRLNDFIGQKCLKLKLRSAFVPTWSWIFIKM